MAASSAGYFPVATETEGEKNKSQDSYHLAAMLVLRASTLPSILREVLYINHMTTRASAEYAFTELRYDSDVPNLVAHPWL